MATGDRPGAGVAAHRGQRTQEHRHGASSPIKLPQGQGSRKSVSTELRGRGDKAGPQPC